MMAADQKEICRKILVEYGKDHQIAICVEECAELIDALCKFKRRRISFDEGCREIADVMIVTTQMAMVFGEKAVDNAIESKLARQMQRMEAQQ